MLYIKQQISIQFDHSVHPMPKREPKPKLERACFGIPLKRPPIKLPKPPMFPKPPKLPKLPILPMKLPPNWPKTEPTLLGVQLMRKLPWGMQALTKEEAAPPMVSPSCMPVMMPAGPPITPPAIPPTTLPMMGPYFCTVLNTKPATLGMMEKAADKRLPRNSRRAFSSCRLLLGPEVSNYKKPPLSFILVKV